MRYTSTPNKTKAIDYPPLNSRSIYDLDLSLNNVAFDELYRRHFNLANMNSIYGSPYRGGSNLLLEGDSGVANH